MKDLTVIVPIINMKNEKNQELVKKAINSVDDSSILIVGPEEDIKIIENLKLNKMIRVLINKNENTSYPFQVNMGVKDIKTKYFSILEFDDEYSNGASK